MKTLRVLLALALFSSASFADTLEGRVVRVLDGDTVSVLDSANAEHRIRLMGIDAPEKAQPFGQRSKESLSDLVYGKAVMIEYGKTDRYGRIIGKITVNGLDANLEQVKAGMAWHYKKYQSEQSPEDRIEYTRSEERAQAGKMGLWVDPDPVPPWEWRKK